LFLEDYAWGANLNGTGNRTGHENAIKEGYSKFGLESFLVKQIQTTERALHRRLSGSAVPYFTRQVAFKVFAQNGRPGPLESAGFHGGAGRRAPLRSNGYLLVAGMIRVSYARRAALISK
jgi:hypothetical protein